MSILTVASRARPMADSLAVAARRVLVTAGLIIGFAVLALVVADRASATEADARSASSGGLLGVLDVPALAAEVTDSVREPITQPVTAAATSATTVAEPVVRPAAVVTEAVTAPAIAGSEPAVAPIAALVTVVTGPAAPVIQPLVVAAAPVLGPVESLVGPVVTPITTPVVDAPGPAVGAIGSDTASVVTAPVVMAPDAAAVPSPWVATAWPDTAQWSAATAWTPEWTASATQAIAAPTAIPLVEAAASERRRSSAPAGPTFPGTPGVTTGPGTASSGGGGQHSPTALTPSAGRFGPPGFTKRLGPPGDEPLFDPLLVSGRGHPS